MKDYINYQYDRFADDELFIKWVLHPNEQTDGYWNNFIVQHPEKRNDINIARKIVLGFQANEDLSSEIELQEIWQKLETKHQKSKTRKLYYMVAASISILIVIGGASLWFAQNKANTINWEAMNLENSKSKLILGEKSVVEFDKQTVTIDYRTANCIKIDQDSTLNLQNNKSSKEMDEIVVPFGKRMQIFLQDGTNIWVNSGTKLVFPRVFNSNKREVYLLGEAFFKVSKDARHPFLVHTPSQVVKVLGTSFNIKAYSDEQNEETVLIEGKVCFSDNSNKQTTTLDPGQKGTINKLNHAISVIPVDVKNYISWIDGYLIFKNEHTQEVIKQISRFFNVPIETSDDYNHATFSGKTRHEQWYRRRFKSVNQSLFYQIFSQRQQNNINTIKISPM